MSFSLVPDRLYEAYWQITPAMLQSWGIRLLLCDLDYTLAPRSVARPGAQVLDWVHTMQEGGIEVMILSNNRSSARVETFCKDMGITYVGHAGKPAKRGYRQAMAKAGVTNRQTAMLGDKLLTDVLGAKRSNILALMVEPLGGPVGTWNHILHMLQAPFKAMTKENYL